MSTNAASQQFLKGSLISLIAFGIMGIFNYLIRRSLALNLPEEGFGFFYSAFSLFMIFIALLDLGLSRAGTISISEHLIKGADNKAGEVYKHLFFIKLFASLGIFLLLVVVSPLLLNQYFNYSGPAGTMIFVLFALMVPFTALESAPVAALDSAKAFTVRNFLQINKVVVTFLIVIIWVPLYGLYAATIAFSVGALIMLCTSHFALLRIGVFTLAPQMGKLLPGIRRIWQKARWMAISFAGLSIIYYLDTQMLTLLDDLVAVGQYSVALSIVQIIQSLMVLPIVFIPIATELWHKKAIKEICHINTAFSHAMHFFFWLMLIGLWPLADILITLLFHEKFAVASTSLSILAVGIIFLSAAQFFIGILSVIGRARIASIFVLTGIAINIILNAILIPAQGIVGAAIATTCSYLFIGIVSCIYLYRCHLFKNELWYSCVLFCGGIVATIFSYQLCQTENIIYKIGFATACSLAYTLLALPTIVHSWRLSKVSEKVLNADGKN